MKVFERSFFDNTIQHLNDNGITEIAAVVGYRKEKFDHYSQIKLFENKNFNSNNILHSLFCAREFMDDDTIILYGDIWFESQPIKSIISSKHDFTIAVDKDWEPYYEGRTEHPLSEAENIHFDQNLQAIRIGKHINHAAGERESTAEFMGLLKITKAILPKIIYEFEALEKKLNPYDSFQSAKTFQTAYLTDFLQYLINHSYSINCDVNSMGWAEIDTQQDLQRFREKYNAV